MTSRTTADGRHARGFSTKHVRDVAAPRAFVRNAVRFIVTTVLAGIAFLVPVLALAVLVAKVARVLRRLAQPLAERLSLNTLFGVLVSDVLVVAVLIVACFVGGLLARVSFASRFVKKAEAGVLWRIPGYGLLKGLTDTLDKNAAEAALCPVLIHFDDATQLALEVDRLADGRRVIYVPSSPDPRSGSVFLMEARRVEAVSVSFVAALGGLRALGRGLGPALSRGK